MTKRRQFPRRIRVVLDIEVRRVTEGAMRDVVADHASAEGAWDDDLETIYVLKTLSPRKRDEVLRHEFRHMLIDAGDRALEAAYRRK